MDSVARAITQRRIAKGLSMRAVAAKCEISPSHLGRIERGERFPSAFGLRKFAKPLGFNESELFTLAGFLCPLVTQEGEIKPEVFFPVLDPHVARVLSQEPVQIQRTVIDILALLKSVAQTK